MDKEELRKGAENSFNGKKVLYKSSTDKCSYIDGFEDGYNKAMNEQGYKVESVYDEGGMTVGRDKAELTKAVNELHKSSVRRISASPIPQY